MTTITALLEFAANARRAGPVEQAMAVLLAQKVVVVASMPSMRAAQLVTTKGIGLNDILILGTGDLLGIPTATNDRRAVASAQAQGVTFNVVMLPPVQFAGR